MDPVIAKSIVSRKKSISVLQTDIAVLEAKAKTSEAPAAVLVLREMAKIKSQRLVKLQAELVALEQLLVDERQLEVPGTVGPGGLPKRR